jgi:hypothetical protein
VLEELACVEVVPVEDNHYERVSLWRTVYTKNFQSAAVANPAIACVARKERLHGKFPFFAGANPAISKLQRQRRCKILTTQQIA